MATKKKVAPKSTKKAVVVKKKATGGKAAPAKKVAAAKHAVAKKATAKKTVEKKPAAKKPAANKTVANKKVTVKKTVEKKPAVKTVKPVAKKPVAVKSARPATASHHPVHATNTAHASHHPVSGKTAKKPLTKDYTIKFESKFVANKSKKSTHTDSAHSNKSSLTYQPEFVKSVLDRPEQSSGPVYRYSDGELQEFRGIILRKLETAKKELTYLQGLITRKDETGTDDTENKYMSMEDGSGTMEREQLNQMASRQIQFIDHLEKALMRIENKTYGICRVTGKLIDKARLRAVPHATLSIEAKQAMNK